MNTKQRERLKLRRKVEKERIKIASAALALLKEVKNSDNPQQYKEKVEEIEKMSHRACCSTKPRLTMEEAARGLVDRDSTIVPYICRECHWVHFGHGDRRSYISKLRKALCQDVL